MPTLSARFLIEITAPCLITWPENLPCEWTLNENIFGIKLKLLTAGNRSKFKDDINWTAALNEIEILISREDEEIPPNVIVTHDGKRDLTILQSYLGRRLQEYSDIAYAISNRVLQFFKYDLNTPLVQHISKSLQALQNPTWYDSKGVELLGGNSIYVSQPVSGLDGKLGVKRLTPNEQSSFTEFLKHPYEVSLSDSLLSDAQTAWFQGNLRRSVLELAICTEVIVKRKFFSEESPAGAAFDYLEDKGKISVRVLDLIDGAAKEAFFYSYKIEHNEKYTDIDHLFRCRNKIAHRGELAFRNDSGYINVNAQHVESWWLSVKHLKDWLNLI